MFFYVNNIIFSVYLIKCIKKSLGIKGFGYISFIYMYLKGNLVCFRYNTKVPVLFSDISPHIFYPYKKNNYLICE